MIRSVTIVIPCYNEAERFPLDVFRAYLDSHPAIHFLLVNDGSRDKTIDLLRRARCGYEEQVGIVDLPVNGGKGEAVRNGMLAALEREECRYAGFWDADMATPLGTIDEMCGVLESRPGLAMIFGARVKLLGRQVERRASRHYLGRVFATVVSSMLRLSIYDTQCGAKLFRSTAEVKALFTEPFSSRWVFDVEILARFIRGRHYDMPSVEAAIYEYPLHEWRDVAGSKVRPRDFVRAMWEVARIHLRYGKTHQST